MVKVGANGANGHVGVELLVFVVLANIAKSGIRRVLCQP